MKSIFHHFLRAFSCQKLSQRWECAFNKKIKKQATQNMQFSQFSNLKKIMQSSCNNISHCSFAPSFTLLWPILSYNLSIISLLKHSFIVSPCQKKLGIGMATTQVLGLLNILVITFATTHIWQSRDKVFLSAVYQTTEMFCNTTYWTAIFCLAFKETGS